jgi:dTDP-4-dehydrorhamnose 3,5-epimerase-like enzyme
MAIPTLIKGNQHKDERGLLRFVNDFSLSAVQRMYCIEPTIDLIRAWQGHQNETKWFYVSRGRFEVQLVSVQNENVRFLFYLAAEDNQVLEIPSGFYNGFKACRADSQLMVFSDKSLKESTEDDLRKTISELTWQQ